MRDLVLVLCLDAIALSACADDSASGGGGAGGASAGGPPGGGGAGVGGHAPACASHTAGPDPDFSVPPGRFVLNSQDGYATFLGSVLSDVPVAFHSETERSGICRLLEYSPSFCSPACDPGDFCVDSACVGIPDVVDAGAMTLTDWLPEPVEVTNNLGIYSWSSDATGSVGRAATITAAGGDAGPFSLSACVPDVILPVGDWSAAMEARGPGEDVTLTWSNVAPGARVYLRMTTGIGTHGGISPVEIECEGPDTGTLTLPGTYLDALYATGWACGECGDNEVRRYYSDEAEVAPGAVRFRAEAVTRFFFRP